MIKMKALPEAHGHGQQTSGYQTVWGKGRGEVDGEKKF